MTRPVYQPGVRFDSAGAGGWLCPMGARMAKKRPPGGQGLSHSPADGGDYPWEVTLLPSVVNGWRTGSVQSPGLHPAVRRPVVRTAISPSAWACMARRPVGGGRCGEETASRKGYTTLSQLDLSGRTENPPIL